MSDLDPDALTRSVELVRRAQAGERPALERLFERYYDRVRRIVRARLGPELRLRVESVDILQETFTAAVGSFDRRLLPMARRLEELKVSEQTKRDLKAPEPIEGEPLAYRLSTLWAKREQKFARPAPDQTTPPVYKRRLRERYRGGIDA